jgi:fumarate reductase subunit D
VSGQYWYKRPNGLVGGPHTLDEMRRVYSQGTLARSQQVSIDGGESWRSASEFPELFQRPAGPPPRPPNPPPNIAEPDESLLGGGASGLDFNLDLGTQPPMPVGHVHPRNTSEPQTNGMAIAGFVLSLLGCTCITALLGFIFSLVALNSSNRANRGLAIAGAIIGGLWLLAWVVLVALWVLGLIVVAASGVPV